MKAKLPTFAIVATLCCALVAFPGAAGASELEDMKILLRQLQARIERLEAEKAVAMPAAPSVTPGNPSLPANSGVALYGKLDLFAEYDSRGSKGTRAAIDSGGLNGSRWGIKGGADVGKGLRGIFQVEGGFYANKGSSAQGGLLFGRQAYAGVEGGFGTLTVGRQYSPLYNTVLSFDPYEQGYGSPTNSGQVSAGSARYDSSLIYKSPSFNGFSGSAMAALGGQTGNRRDAVALSASYSAGPIGLAVAYQDDDHISTTVTRSRHVFVGASYRLGATRIMGGGGEIKANLDAGGSTLRREWMLGSKTTVTPTGQLLMVYGGGKTDTLDNASRAIALGWIEALSQQMNVYGIVASHANAAASTLVPLGASSAGSYSVNPGDSALGLALGLQYSF